MNPLSTAWRIKAAECQAEATRIFEGPKSGWPAAFAWAGAAMVLRACANELDHREREREVE